MREQELQYKKVVNWIHQYNNIVPPAPGDYFFMSPLGRLLLSLPMIYHGQIWQMVASNILIEELSNLFLPPFEKDKADFAAPSSEALPPTTRSALMSRPLGC